MDLEEKVKLHRSLSQKIDELEEQKKALGLAIMEAMQEKTMRMDGLVVRCCSRLSIKLTLEEARALNAVKFEETVDKDKIKLLCKGGQEIQGVSEIRYLQITTSRE